MATYPKLLKPWRGFPNMNGIHAVRFGLNVQTPSAATGTVGLPNGKAFHIGTIPAGSFVGPVSTHVKTALAGGTVDIGTQTDPTAILASAALTAGFKADAAGTVRGRTTIELPLFALATGNLTAGELDVLISFYIHAD